jgi:hypothetical protein
VSSLGRAATWVAVAALAVNAVLLGVAGAVAGRPLLVVGALASAAAAAAVLVAWRRHQRLLADMSADRQALRDEALALRDLVRRPPG